MSRPRWKSPWNVLLEVSDCGARPPPRHSRHSLGVRASGPFWSTLRCYLKALAASALRVMVLLPNLRLSCDPQQPTIIIEPITNRRQRRQFVAGNAEKLNTGAGLRHRLGLIITSTLMTHHKKGERTTTTHTFQICPGPAPPSIQFPVISKRGKLNPTTPSKHATPT
ncbi:hypothetical protein BS47DRAFT_1395767 [Hydnum rufescens UP504]|uniref:Uncharacterized protein n=1 Tax=Hydnum rufescens UP504 TaxID=1448309 RepID=A0A9P6DTL3_9AGAM|nr:hypothetical protein BS47DRAFT_1395767 [Hydnum rufescens UP504]